MMTYSATQIIRHSNIHTLQYSDILTHIFTCPYTHTYIQIHTFTHSHTQSTLTHIYTLTLRHTHSDTDLPSHTDKHPPSHPHNPTCHQEWASTGTPDKQPPRQSHPAQEGVPLPGGPTDHSLLDPKALGFPSSWSGTTPHIPSPVPSEPLPGMASPHSSLIAP